MSEQIKYHKKTYFPSSYLSAQFDNFNSDQIYFTSGNKLILFDIMKNQKVFRINLKGKKIIYITQSEIDNDEIFVLDIDNCFYQFKISTKEVISSFILNKNNKYSNFYINKNKIYFYTNNKFLLSILEISLTENGTKIQLFDEYSILNEKLQKTFKIDQIKPAIFTIKNDYLITNYENVLFIHNLITKSTNQIHFYKKITCLSFINNSINTNSICLGDNAGKIHFISDITDKNVKLLLYNYIVYCIYKTLAFS